MKIKTLAEILAESDIDSASLAVHAAKKPSKKDSGDKKSPKNAAAKIARTREDSAIEYFSANKSHHQTSPSTPSTPSKKRKKRFHPAAHFEPEQTDTPQYQAPKAQSIQQILAEVKREMHTDENRVAENQRQKSTLEKNSLHNAESSQSDTDNLPAALKAYLRTPEQKQAEIDAIKAASRLRWLAFYYLSRREYGKAELKQKLLDKEQDPASIDALLDEFSDKGYQSDYRTTLMLIRENIRKGRGRQRIKQAFYQKKMAMPSNIDELIDMANAESDAFSEFVNEDEDSLVDGVDWLKMAVTARTKKYGDNIPVEQKEKAKQLRFLQYRGFKSDICFEALNYTLDTLNERF